MVVVTAGPPHPLGVKPSGNAALCKGRVLSVVDAFGPRLGRLGEGLVLQVLRWLDARSLAEAGCVSQGAFVYCSFDELWRELALAEWKARQAWRFAGSWKRTVLGVHEQQGPGLVPRGTVCSDTLYRTWQYATAEISAKWLRRQRVETRRAQDLGVQEFVDEFERPCRPVLITGALDGKRWPILAKWGSCGDRPRRPAIDESNDKLTKQSFRVGPVDMVFDDFLRYSELQAEESPLYLFDCKFVERTAPAQTTDSAGSSNPTSTTKEAAANVSTMAPDHLYQTPKYFANTEHHPHRDLFECMGGQRPDYRWLIVGPARSGSKWHIDPNSTHAWNAVVSGSKRWLMFPPGNPPPGVTPSADGSEVTQPVSLMEWFANFYDAQQAPVEFTANPGDLVFIPSGWWHCVLNLTPCVAITQNYISDTNLSKALAMMRDRPHLVSGLARQNQRETLYKSFKSALSQTWPALLERIERAEQERKRRRIDATTDRDFRFSFF